MPYVIKAKLIIQEPWRRHIAWDDELPNNILQKWQSLKEGLKASQTIMIPRWYGFHRNECQNVQLHVFSDASEIAYGTVSYFHTETRGCIDVSFVISKTRLVPIKTLTVPQLELPAAVMASRLKSMIFEESNLEINETYFWSDAEMVLHYFSNTQDSAPTVPLKSKLPPLVSFLARRDSRLERRDSRR